MKLTKNEYRLLKHIDRLGWQNLSRLSDMDVGRSVILRQMGMLQIINESILGITPEGRHAMEEYREYVTEQRWTRVLAIAAIIISIVSLFVTSS